MNENKYDLAIGIIVKNEIELLRDCLEALHPLRKLINMQLIITDTGSTDGTIEVAKEYADEFIEFEWCNDFSKARNTAVEVCDADWFMFLDADEIFDFTIDKIAEFINSSDRERYDNAGYIIRNYASFTDKNRFEDFPTVRLFNFTGGKRYFEEKVHETIPRNSFGKNIESIAHHYGYVREKLVDKKIRNKEIMEKQLEKEPDNIRYKMLYSDVFEGEELISYLEKITYEMEEQKEESEFTAVAYMRLAREYYFKESVSDLYSVIQRIENNGDDLKYNLPYTTMLYYTINTAEKSKILNAEIFSKLVEKYEKTMKLILERNKKGKSFRHIGFYYGYKTDEYNLMEVKAIYFNRLINTVEPLYAEKVRLELLKSDIYKYKDDKDRHAFLIPYLDNLNKIRANDKILEIYVEYMKEKNNFANRQILRNCIFKMFKDERRDNDECFELFANYDNEKAKDSLITLCKFIKNDNDFSKLDKSLIEQLKNDEDIYVDNIFANFFVASLFDSVDYLDLIKKANQTTIINNMRVSFKTYDNVLENYLSYMKDKNVKDIKNLSELQILYSMSIVVAENILTSFYQKKDLIYAYEKHVEISSMYIRKIYNEEALKDESIYKILGSYDIYILKAGEILSDESMSVKDSIAGLIKLTKEFNVAKEITLMYTRTIKEVAVEKTKTVNKEINELAGMIKVQLLTLINAKEFESAKLILDKYKQLNPNDKDIKNFERKINNK